MDIKLAGVFVLAFLCEAIVEYLFADLLVAFGKLIEHVGVRVDCTKALKYVAVGVGIALCFGYDIDLIAILGFGLKPAHPAIGIILSGIVIGRGSNYLNDFLGLCSNRNKRRVPISKPFPR